MTSLPAQFTQANMTQRRLKAISTSATLVQLAADVGTTPPVATAEPISLTNKHHQTDPRLLRYTRWRIRDEAQLSLKVKIVDVLCQLNE